MKNSSTKTIYSSAKIPCEDCMCPQTCDNFERCMLVPLNDVPLAEEETSKAALVH